MNSATSRLFVFLQWFIPKSVLTSVFYKLTHIRNKAVKDLLIRRFISAYDVDADEALFPVPEGFACFNDFFTRELQPGSRPVDQNEQSLISPADGTVSAAGSIVDDRIFQAKGLDYTLAELLSTDLGDVQKFVDGSFVTVYLAPANYHRVHCPFAGELVVTRYIPGDLFSVNTATVAFLPNLFSRNERLVCHFECDFGPLVAVLVGALNVGSITTPWTGEIRPRQRGVVEEIDVHQTGTPLSVAKGDLLGWFNMGSTVILLLPPDAAASFDSVKRGQEVRMGQPISTVRRNA